MQCRDMLCAQSIYLKHDQDHSGMLSCHEARDALSAIGALLFSNTHSLLCLLRIDASTGLS